MSSWRNPSEDVLGDFCRHSSRVSTRISSEIPPRIPPGGFSEILSRNPLYHRSWISTETLMGFLQKFYQKFIQESGKLFRYSSGNSYEKSSRKSVWCFSMVFFKKASGFFREFVWEISPSIPTSPQELLQKLVQEFCRKFPLELSQEGFLMWFFSDNSDRKFPWYLQEFLRRIILKMFNHAEMSSKNSYRNSLKKTRLEFSLKSFRIFSQELSEIRQRNFLRFPRGFR